MATTGAIEFTFRTTKVGGFEIVVDVIVVGDVTGKLRFFPFKQKRINDGLLDLFATSRMDWVGNVGVKFRTTLGNPEPTIFIKTTATGVAKTGPHLIFESATETTVHQLAAGHRNEIAFGATNDFEIAHDKRIVECDRTESQEALVFAILVDKLYPDLCDVHGADPPWNLIDAWRSSGLGVRRVFAPPAPS
jgi:hypothetical protein